MDKVVGLISAAPRSRRRALAIAIAAAPICWITACNGSTGSASRSSAVPTRSPEIGVTVTPTTEMSGRAVSQTRVQFTVRDTKIIVRIADNPASRDFISMLPLTLKFSDFNAMEKIGQLPRRLNSKGFAGRPPADGDLIYFVPWGNLGFFYNSAHRDASYDDRVIPIGTVETGYDRLNELETGAVRVERVP